MNLYATYVNLGWHLIPIPMGRKGPCYAGWNRPENEIASADSLDAITENVGLAHAYSRTCAVDIDDLEAAAVWLASQDIDLPALLAAPEAVQIDSGRGNRAKLLYRLPDDVAPLPTKTLRGEGIEFRCGTANGLTVQDVLPPSIHPDTGQPYQWRGDYTRLPPLPAALLTLWRSL